MTLDPPLVALACALLSLAARFRYPEHAPVALALCLSAARDLAGPVLRGEPGIDAGALCLVACASGRAYELALGRPAMRTNLAWGLAAVLLFVVATSGSWSPVLVAYLAAVVAGGLALYRWDEERSVATDTAIVLLIGDMAGLACGWRSDAVPGQAVVQLATASVVQLAWLIAGPASRTPRGPSSTPPREPSPPPRARPA